jgi:hypothetical protein
LVKVCNLVPYSLVYSLFSVLFFWRNNPPVGHGLLIHEVSISHTMTRHSRQDFSGRVISSSQRPLYLTTHNGFGGLKDACWPLVPKFACSNPAEAFGLFRAKKIPSTPSFGGEVKPAVPCRRFAACKRSLYVTWKLAFRQNSRLLFLAH